jgi:hypothetical protein
LVHQRVVNNEYSGQRRSWGGFQRAKSLRQYGPYVEKKEAENCLCLEAAWSCLQNILRIHPEHTHTHVLVPITKYEKMERCKINACDISRNVIQMENPKIQSSKLHSK